MKDPAALFYINDWLTATMEMDADCRGWYLNMILHQFDKGSLPNDIEKLAVLCGVKFSEFTRFEHVFEHVLKHKFEQDDEGRLKNKTASRIIKSREFFLDKRSKAGRVSYLLRYMKSNYGKQYRDSKLQKFVKERADLSIDFKDEEMFKQMFEHLFELYRNENEINSNNIVSSSNKSKLDIEWKGDFQIYKTQLREKYGEVVKDAEWIALQERLNPGVDVRASIDKACVNFWATEAGWKHKKKSGSDTIDWRQTFGNAITFNQNIVKKAK
jgi:hypothetical protein